MTINEFILLDKHKVRRDSNLMHLYLEFFQETFGRVPNCAGCSFGSDWQKLVSKYSKNSLTLQKVNYMKTIQIKKIQGKILTYRKEGKTFRMYDNILNDNFINEYLSNGTEEEIEERRKMFVFPKKESYKQTLTFESELPKDEDEVIAIISNEITDELGIKNFVVKKRGRKSKK